MTLTELRREDRLRRADEAGRRAVEAHHRAWRLMALRLMEGPALRAVIRYRRIADLWTRREAFYRGGQ